MATIKDVAKLAGVSTTTVSLVLNQKAGSNRVSQETQDRIFEAVKTLNYKPNLSARRLKQTTPRRYSIAVYWPINGRKSYLANVIGHLDTAIKKRSFPCDLIIKFFDKDGLSFERGLQDPYAYDGVIIGALSTIDMAFLADYKPLMPAVLFNRQVEGYDAILSSPDTAYEAFMVSFKKMHIDRVAIFMTRDVYLGTRDRIHKFIKLCQVHEIKIKTYISESNYEAGYQMACDFHDAKDQSQFIFCETERIAIGASRAFTERGLSIPNDIQLASISLSNPNTTEFVTPSITIVQLPTDEMADAIIDRLYSHIYGVALSQPKDTFDLKTYFRESFLG